MKIQITSVFVQDQEAALRFYTEVLGFVKKTEMPLGRYKWLMVVSPDGPQDVELLLEPISLPASRVYQKALFEEGIPTTAFAVEDVRAEYERLRELGVEFRVEPTSSGEVTIAVFDDTCGNYIQIYQR